PTRRADPVPADPVRGLLERHSRLCANAADPWEIAVGLEAAGVTDRTAAVRYRHRDVFSLAEELYARLPRPEPGERPPTAEPARPAARRRRVPIGRPLAALLPGLLCLATYLALAATEEAAPATRLAVGVGGGVLAAPALAWSLRGLAVPARGVFAACWLTAYALYGDGLLAAVLAGGPEEPPALAPWWVPLTLAFAVAVGLGCARWFDVRVRTRLAVSRGLAEFASAVRPLLALTLGLFVAAVASLWLAVHRLVAPGGGPPPAEAAALTALALLLFLALLLAAHGFPGAAATGLAVACVAELLVLAVLFAARLPWLGALAAPVEELTAAFGPAAVPAVLCGVTALGLLGRTAGLLSGASAYRCPWTGRPAR
ncbi:hypothetical protein H3146_23100, partial [Streptomyces sp. OF3]